MPLATFVREKTQQTLKEYSPSASKERKENSEFADSGHLQIPNCRDRKEEDSQVGKDVRDAVVSIHGGEVATMPVERLVPSQSKGLAD